MTKKNKAFSVWQAYIKYLRKVKFPEKPLKWVLQVYHPAHRKEYEKFKKDPKVVR